MRRSPEIMILLGLLLLGIGGILWYVADRRAKNRAAPPPVAAKLVPPTPGTVPDQPVALGGANERKTIDFTSGKAVVKDSAADRAAIDAAMKDIAAAQQEVTFAAPQKKIEPPPVPPKN